MKLKILVTYMLAAAMAVSALTACSDKEDGGNSSEAEQSTLSSADTASSEDSSADSSEDAADERVYTVDIEDLSPYVQLGTYKGVEMEKTKVTDATVEAQIKLLLDSEKTLEDVGTSRPAALGDTVVMDYTGYYKDTGEAFSGGTDQDASLLLGSGKFIAGFEDAIVGHTAGEEFDIFVTFPENYGTESLQGVEARFAIKLKKVSEYVYPELTDALAVKLKFEGADALKAKAKENAETAAYTENLDKAWKAAVANCKIIKFPEAHYNQAVDDFVSYYMTYYKTMAAQYGVELEELIGQTEEELKAELTKMGDEYANGFLKEELIVCAILKDMDAFEVSEEEYNTKVQEYADKEGVTTDKLKENYNEKQLLTNILWDRAMTYVYDNSVDKPASDK